MNSFHFLRRCPLLPVVLATFLLPLTAVAPAEAGLPGQVLIETGLAVPYGDPGRNFEDDRLGLGCGKGFEMGFRFRHPLSHLVSLSPGFHFLDYQDHSGLDADGEPYSTEVFSYRYTLELMIAEPERPDGPPSPFLAFGMGLYRNRLQGYYYDLETPVNESINTLGYSVRSGVSYRGFELSWVYHVNRFNSWRLYRSNYRERYDWDNFGWRLGWVLPLD